MGFPSGRKRGYTLPELLVVGGLMATLATYGLWAARRQSEHDLLEQAAASIVAELRAARMQAVSHQVKVTITMDPAGRLLSEADLDRDGAVTEDERREIDMHTSGGIDIHLEGAPGWFTSLGTFRGAGSRFRVELQSQVGRRYVHVVPSGHVEESEQAW